MPNPTKFTGALLVSAGFGAMCDACGMGFAESLAVALLIFAGAVLMTWDRKA